MSAKYTCITCSVAFGDADIQRLHYKSDWHRYNLKRKVAELPPVTAEEFQRRVLIQREKDQEENAPSSIVQCKTCRKTFSTQNAYENHLNSKKHKQTLLENISETGNDAAVIVQVKQSADGSEESDVEEVDSDEWEEEENPILNNNCIFCSNHSANMMKNLKHMTVEHSFFIPDAEYLTDLKGLLTYLGEKVSQGHMCLWCNDRGRNFHSALAAQQHMQDKGHCKMLHEGEALAEYADFYDYSSSYPDQEETTADEEVDEVVLDGSDYELVLPSGSRIGHRSLMRYYRQNIDPNRSVVPQQKKVHRMLAHYRALGWTPTQKEAAIRKAKDIEYMRRVQSKYSTKLGVKSNKLQKHFRPQVNF